ncbi:MAG: hypothetical protein ACXACD_02010 [Candidatus Thorarchaeota archaeon]|jgi:hypothetical protein
MKRKPILLAFVLVLFITSIGPRDSQNSPDYAIEHTIIRTPLVAQTPQNISSYLDFALAAGSILADNLVNITDGRVFHEGDFEWNYILNGSTLADYYWAISGLSKAYNQTGNTTIFSMIGKMANKMVEIYMDTIYSGYYINTWSAPIITGTKRAGIQAYAYYALTIAENTDPALNFTVEKQSAIDCLTDMLYDSENGGFHFFTLRNGSLNIPSYIYEVYPADGKRLDHLALGILALYDAGESTGNATLTAMANRSLDFMINYMPYINETDHYLGLRLAMNRTGGEPVIDEIQRPARTVVTDINALAIRSLLKGYQITGNMTFLEWAQDTFFAILRYNWDQEEGAWFLETLDGEPYDPYEDEDVKWYKYSEIQFQMVLSLEDLYELTSNTFYIQLSIDTLDFVIAKLWDTEYGGFMKNSNREGLVISQEWQVHLAAVQGLAVEALERIWSFGLPIVSYVRVAPTNPRPTDNITLLVTATDADGIDTVFANMSIEYEGGENNISIVEIPENPDILGTFNTTISPLPDGTRINFYVFANDTLGNVFIAGNYFFNVKLDIYGPVVVLSTTYPSDEILAGEDVFIEFKIYEYPLHSVILSCQLYWKVNDGVYTAVNMTWYDIDGDFMLWLVDIGHFEADDVVSFYCIAVDESLNVGQSAFYRLTILSMRPITPWVAWQTFAMIGLIVAPGIGYSFTRLRRERALSTQRDLKKEARKRSTKKRPRRRRSTRSD